MTGCRKDLVGWHWVGHLLSHFCINWLLSPCTGSISGTVVRLQSGRVFAGPKLETWCIVRVTKIKSAQNG